MFAVLTRVRGGKTHGVRVKKAESWNSNFGVLKFDELLEKGPGAIVNAIKPVKGGSGERYVWRWASLEDYVTLMARRAATPIYSKDAWALVGLLDAGPGKKILEAGSGIGALTLSLSRAGADVVSVENRVEAMKCAQGNVSRWWAHEKALMEGNEGGDMDSEMSGPRGYGAVQWVLGDLERVLELHEEHFGVVEKYSAAVLDMMTPWKVLDATVNVVKPGGVIAVYAPNITQVTETVSAAPKGVFVERVMEVGLRDWEVGKVKTDDGEAMIAHPAFSQTVSHTGFLLILRVKRTAGNMGIMVGGDLGPGPVEAVEEAVGDASETPT